MPAKPTPPGARAPHVQAALARTAQPKMPERVNPVQRSLAPAQQKWRASHPPGTHVVQKADQKKEETKKVEPTKEEPKKQKILDLRPKVQGDPNPLSNYEAWIPVITNAAQYGIDKAPLVYVTNGWHYENPNTQFQRLHFDISLDGSNKLHVYFDPFSGTVSIG